MKTFSEFSQSKGVRWTALVALLVGLTQFNTGIKVFYSKWTADEAAAEAKQVAGEAKDTAVTTSTEFKQYLQQQQQAIETQNKIAEAIQGYAAQQQTANQQQLPPPANVLSHTIDNSPSVPSVWIEPEPIDGRWVCASATERWWADPDTGCD